LQTTAADAAPAVRAKAAAPRIALPNAFIIVSTVAYTMVNASAVGRLLARYFSDLCKHRFVSTANALPTCLGRTATLWRERATINQGHGSWE
jgi:hypothetical protein